VLPCSKTRRISALYRLVNVVEERLKKQCLSKPSNLLALLAANAVCE